MKKRLLLISPLGKKGLMGSDFYFRLPYLGLLKVAALTPPDWEVRIIDEKVESLDLGQDADLVGITAMTPVVKRGYAIADHFRKRGIPVVMGGMHVSKLPDEARQRGDRRGREPLGQAACRHLPWGDEADLSTQRRLSRLGKPAAG